MATKRGESCQCKCGKSELILSQRPRARFFCHCLTCQEVYGLPFADVVIVRSKSVTLEKDSHIEYKKFSPNLARGVCTGCERPVVSILTMAPFLKIAFIPTANLPATVKKPPSHAHIYYHRCGAPVEDDLPKISGAAKSNFKILPHMLWGLMGA